MLHQAIENDQIDMAKYLVDKGADLNLTDTKGNTALHIATENNQTDMVKYLTDKGAKLNITNAQKQIPLDIADQKHNPHLKEKLFEEIDLFSPNDNKRQSSVRSEQSTRSNSQTNSRTPEVEAGTYRTVAAKNTTTPIIPTLTQPTKRTDAPYQNPQAAEIGASIRKEGPNNTLASATAVANELESKQKLPDNHSTKQPATPGMTRVPMIKVTRGGPGQSNTR